MFVLFLHPFRVSLSDKATSSFYCKVPVHVHNYSQICKKMEWCANGSTDQSHLRMWHLLRTGQNIGQAPWSFDMCAIKVYYIIINIIKSVLTVTHFYHLSYDTSLFLALCSTIWINIPWKDLSALNHQTNLNPLGLRLMEETLPLQMHNHLHIFSKKKP
jgi:hypothetical protein